MISRPIVVERVCAWHLPFLRYESWRGRTLWSRSMDPALEASRTASSAPGSAFPRELPLRRELIAFMGPETDLAIAFIADRYDALVGRLAATRSVERLYGDPAIHQAYRKALADLLTRYFELARLAAAAREALGSEVEIVPAALRDVDSFLTGRSLTRGWSHPDAPVTDAGLPAWLRTIHSAHVTARAARSAAAMTWESIAPGGRSGARERFDTAFAIVGATRELQATARGVGFLLDGRSLTRERSLFVPVAALTEQQREHVRSRGLRLADPGRGRPRRAAALRATLANAVRRDWIARTTTEVLRVYRRWSGFTERYDVGTFVSYADTGIWPVARNVLLHARGVRTVGYSDSANHGFHAAQTQRSRAPANTHLAYLVYDEFATWNDRLLRFLQGHAQLVGRYHVIGCPWTDHVAMYRRDRDRSALLPVLRERGFRDGQPLVTAFDSWYHPHGINQAADLAQFLIDLLRLLDERPDLYVALKKKVPIVFPERDARLIYELHDRIREHPRAVVFPPSVDSSEIAALADLVISFPFTSVSHEALGAGIKGAFYDANEKLRGWYYDQFPGLFLHGYNELRAAVDRLAGADDAAFVARASLPAERPTELYLCTGAIGRLRAIAAGRDAR